MPYCQTAQIMGSERRLPDSSAAMPGYPERMAEWGQPQQPSAGGLVRAHEMHAGNHGFAVSSTLPVHPTRFAPEAAYDVSLHSHKCYGVPLTLQDYNRQRAILEAAFPQIRPSLPGPNPNLCCNPDCPPPGPGLICSQNRDVHPGFAQAPMLQTRRPEVSDLVHPVPTRYVAPTDPGHGKDAVNLAFARWYANLVTELLIYPGSFRKGAGGACSQVWGPGGREKEAWLRIGWNIGGLTAPWARLGTTPRDALCPIRGPNNPRMPWLEQQDPYNLKYGRRSNGPSATLVDFVLNMVNRMWLSPTSILHAAYFLTGVGLHDGDGDRGAKLRKLLVSWYCFDDDRHAIEKRVAMLGVLLAGKWLDDNSFVTRSYHEVTDIPMLHISQLERTVLLDLHHSLFVHLDSWVLFIRHVWEGLIAGGDLDDHGSIVLALVNQSLQESLESQSTMPPARRVPTTISPFLSQYISPNSSPDTKHALLDAWSSYDIPPVSRYSMQQPAPPPEVIEEEDDDDEEEWLDYDGAARWLPSKAEMRRSMSNSSEGMPGLTRTSGGHGDMPSHNSMTSLPRTPGADSATHESSPAVVVSASPPDGGAHPAHQSQPQLPLAADPLAALIAQLHLPSSKLVSHPVSHANALSAAHHPQPVYSRYEGPSSYNMTQRFDTAPESYSYGGDYQYSHAPRQQLPPVYNPYQQGGGSTRRPAYPALPIHALIGDDDPYVGYGQSRGHSTAATSGPY